MKKKNKCFVLLVEKMEDGFFVLSSGLEDQTCRIQNSNIQQAGRWLGAGHGRRQGRAGPGGAGRGGEGQARDGAGRGRAMRPEDDRPFRHLGHRKQTTSWAKSPRCEVLCSAASVERFSQLGTAFGLRCAFSADRGDLSRKRGVDLTGFLSAVASPAVNSRELGGAPASAVKLRNSCF